MSPKHLQIVATISVALLGPVHAKELLSSQAAVSDSEKRRFVEEATARWNEVDRWQIEYEAIPPISSTEFIPVHRIMAVAFPDMYYHFSAHFPRGSNPWEDDPFNQETTISYGKATHAWPFDRTYSEVPMAPQSYMPANIWKDVLWPIIPRWPLTDYKMPLNSEFGTPVILVDAVRSPTYRLLSRHEMMGAEDCVIFENEGVERIWIATHKGLCLMRRDTWAPKAKTVAVRILTDNVKEIASGLWLPIDFHIQFFRSGPNIGEEIVDRENRIHILRCSLNKDVQDSRFMPVHPPGSIKFDEHDNFSQTSPGGEDLLSQIVSFMVKYAHMPSERFPRPHPVGWFLTGLSLGFCIGLFLLRTTKTQQQSDSLVYGERQGDNDQMVPGAPSL